MHSWPSTGLYKIFGGCFGILLSYDRAEYTNVMSVGKAANAASIMLVDLEQEQDQVITPLTLSLAINLTSLTSSSSSSSSSRYSSGNVNIAAMPPNPSNCVPL